MLSVTGAMQAVAHGQINLTSTSGTYTQDFDTLAATGTGSTLPTGWALAETGTGANTSYTADNGTLTAGDTYSYGSTGSSDRALGTLRGTVVSTIGVGFTTTANRNFSATIAYTGEEWQWNGKDDSFTVKYSTDATSLTTGTWTTITGLAFQAPTTSGSTLNGNATANRTAKSVNFVLPVPTTTHLWIQWLDDSAQAGKDAGLAVDDFSISYQSTPEPTTALLFGGAAGAALIGRRRRAAGEVTSLLGRWTTAAFGV